nr:2-hydroxyglutaryl-CoA dehydratase [Desulfobacteraceae bacterium]
MITAGIDIGSITAKAAVLEDGRILGAKVLFTGYNSRQAGQAVLDELMAEIGITREKINAIIATGYGRNSVELADKAITEITCHAAGAHFIDPSVR